MPHATSNPATPSTNEAQLGYSWINLPDGSRSMIRQLTNLERMFVIFNEKLHGQNCPFIGATISLRRRDCSPGPATFSVSQLYRRAVEAFCQTRWKYPTVSARVLDSDKVLYNIESEEDVKKWAERTISVVLQDGGWLALRERLSRESALPTPDGDYCLLYLIVKPEEIANPNLQAFDVLIHTHHAFTDGSGIRVILNEFLERLAHPLDPEETIWGEEIQRLLPASILLEEEEEPKNANAAITPVPEERLKGFDTPDVGLPVYRPDILRPTPEHRGSLLARHTFEDHGFLPQLLAVGRKRGVKLAALLHATLLKAIYDSSDVKPGLEDVYKSGAPMDLRNGFLLPEYCERTKYVNSAVAIQPIHVPCRLFHTEESNDHDFWKVATCISNQWNEVRKKKGLGKLVESDAKSLIEAFGNSKSSSKPSIAKPRTCPSFVTDPPGSQGLRGAYPVSGNPDLAFILESYQLATDQNQALVSARAHSWNGLLTLCLVFNAVRNPRDKMQEFLDKWVETVAAVCKGGDTSTA